MRLSNLGVLNGSGDSALSLKAELFKLPFGDVNGRRLFWTPWDSVIPNFERYLFFMVWISSCLVSVPNTWSRGISISEVLKFKDVSLISGLLTFKLYLRGILLLLLGILLPSYSSYWLQSLSMLLFLGSGILRFILRLNIESMLWFVIFFRVELT